MSTNNNGSTPPSTIIPLSLSQSKRDAYQVPDGYALEGPLECHSITASNQNSFSFEYILVKKEEKPAPTK